MIQYREDAFKFDRAIMVEQQLIPRGIKNKAVLDAFYAIPRECFVTDTYIANAYDDTPLPIGHGQTISQPYIVALMTELLELSESESMKILEVGSGSGYQAAILAYMGHEVITVDRLKEVAEFAKSNLDMLAYAKKVKVFIGDGCLGWPEEAPFDRIIVTAAAPKIPEALIKQLKINGILVIPCGNLFIQQLLQAVKISEDKIKVSNSIGCRFVPLIGKDAFDSHMS